MSNEQNNQSASDPLIVPPARVIALWNEVAEDTGTLEMTLLRFADLLLAEAGASRPSAICAGVSLSEAGCSPRRK